MPVNKAGSVNNQRGRALHGIPVVAIEDIADLRQYVGAVIARRWHSLPAQEQDEMALEALAIVYQLHSEWRPADCPSFRKLCSTYLPFRLVSYWRTEMRRRNGSRPGKDGKWRAGAEVVSLDQLNEREAA